MQERVQWTSIAATGVVFEHNPLSVIYILFNLIGNGTTTIRPYWLLVVTNCADPQSMRDVIQLMGSWVAEDASYVFQRSGYPRTDRVSALNVGLWTVA